MCWRVYMKIKWKLELYYWIFFYNQFTTTNSAIDTVCEPLYWIVEHLAKKAGRIFVGFVTLLTSSVVIIFYVYIVPYIYTRDHIAYTVFLIIFGHWLLMNIVFHYYMGVSTKPGSPTNKVENTISMCKRCISPKPPRTHHCSICKMCVLKMDHHCPWINNCVGHFNHRYFYLYCVYMCSGTIFVTLCVFRQFLDVFMNGHSSFTMTYFSPIINYFFGNVGSLESTVDMYRQLSTENVTSSTEDLVNYRERFWIIYETLLCIAVTIALGTLTLWHGYLISRGETSIEKHINQREAKRLRELGAEYRNPYDFGFKENWRIFLGIENGSKRYLLRHVLLPSTHTPLDNGKRWRTVFEKDM